MKPMKKLFSTILLLFLFGYLFADISVKSFVKVEGDMDARAYNSKKDQNGDVCAIIKVETTLTGFSWDSDGLGIVAVIPKVAEYWVYVPFGAKRLTIRHPQLGILADYSYPLAIEKGTVYRLKLTIGKVISTVEDEITSQWLLIKTEPAKAMIYLNDQYVKTGEYQAKLKSGNYTYRVEMPMYHTEAGTFEITDVKKELMVNLKPAFGIASITSSPESGATVLIDGKEQSSLSPCQSESLYSGVHTVQVIKEMYQSSSQKVTINDGQIIPVNFVMQPNFAEITISAPTNSIVFINNQQKGTGTWNGRLNPGIYSLEVRLDKHRSAKQDIELLIGEKKNYDLQPTPIHGALDIMTTPSGANIIINQKNYGTTPNTINNLLIGNYQVRLIKTGFTTINKNITIYEGKSTSLIDSLIESKSKIDNNLSPLSLKNGIRFSSFPSKAYILQNGNIVGVTPFETDQLADGEYNFEIRQENRESTTIHLIVNKRIYTNYLINLNEAIPTIIYGSKPMQTDSGKGNIIVTSDPYGAKVILDGIYMNTTPCQISDIKTGEHLLEVKFGNYISKKRIIQVKSNDLESYEITSSMK